MKRNELETSKGFEECKNFIGNFHKQSKEVKEKIERAFYYGHGWGIWQMQAKLENLLEEVKEMSIYGKLPDKE